MGRIILTLFLINQMRALFFTATAMTSLMMQDSTATKIGTEVSVLGQVDASIKQQHDASMIQYFLSQLGLEEEKKEEAKKKEEEGKKKEEEGKKKAEEGKKKEEEGKKKAEEGKKKGEEAKKKGEEEKKKGGDKKAAGVEGGEIASEPKVTQTKDGVQLVTDVTKTTM